MAALTDLCFGRAARECFELCRCGWCGERDECLPRTNGTACPGFEPADCGRPVQWAEAGTIAAIFVLMLATFAFSLSLVCRLWCRSCACECGAPADPAMRLTLHRDSDDEG